jgi:HAD superfamily hydrolase (TIGR01450 family)
VILKDKKYFILDLDGTLYKGTEIFPYTIDFINTLHTTGRTPIYFTNNSSRSTTKYLEKLRGIGISCEPKEIYTSANATIEYLLNHDIKHIFLMATPDLEAEFRENGFVLFNDELSLGNDDVHLQLTGKNLPQAVVLAFDKTFTYQKFVIGHELITSGLPFYATHPDTHLPLEGDKMHPDIGTLIEAFYVATGKRPQVIGKPKKHIYQQLKDRLNCKKEQMVMIGDRLDTDIKGANDFGIMSILVLSGETTRQMVTKRSPQPTMIAENIGKLIPQLNN